MHMISALFFHKVYGLWVSVIGVSLWTLDMVRQSIKIVSDSP